MKLRPHHVFCILKYTGHGYDAAFTAHMTETVARLAAAPETALTMTEGCDDLCVCCPHRQGDRCDSFDKTAAMDAGALKALGVRYGETVLWRRLASAAREVFGREGLPGFCRDCQWASLCLTTETEGGHAKC